MKVEVEAASRESDKSKKSELDVYFIARFLAHLLSDQ